MDNDDRCFSLKNNDGKGLTYIYTHYLDLERDDDDNSMYYFDFSNLDGLLVHWMMPYGIVYVSDSVKLKIPKQDSINHSFFPKIITIYLSTL